MGSALITLGFTFVGLLLLSFFFSLSETAITATSLARVYKLRGGGNSRAAILVKLLRKKEEMISITLIGSNTMNIIASSIATYTVLSYFTFPLRVEIAATVTTLIIIIACEILPKTIALSDPEHISIALAKPLRFAHTMLLPILKVLNVITKIFVKIIPSNKSRPIMSVNEVLKSEIEFFHESGSVVKNDRDMLDGVLELNNIEVESIMTPKRNVHMFCIADDTDKIVNLILASGHTRLPVYRTSQDEIIGILHAKELISLLYTKKTAITHGDIEKIIFKPYFISGNTRLKQQLFEFKKTHHHMAIVVDEYGSMSGVLTLEDIIEEIVGSIEDEHDSKKDIVDFVKNEDGSIILKGDYQIRDFNRETGLDFPTDDCSTIAGLVIEQAEKIPDEGEVFVIMGQTFEIVKKHNAKIDLIKVTIVITDDSVDKHK